MRLPPRGYRDPQAPTYHFGSAPDSVLFTTNTSVEMPSNVYLC